MKKLISSSFLLLFAIVFNLPVNAQLNSNASHIKDKFPTKYQNTIRQQSLEKWENDYEMVVYRINNQADALFSLVNSFKSEHTNILFEAIQKWSVDGYQSSNIEKFRNINTVNVENLIGFHCDWEMVKYRYDNQVEAKGSF